MSETNSQSPNKPHGFVRTELPVEIPAERAREVGAYFSQILTEYGRPAEIPVSGKFRVNMWPGRRAEFVNGAERLVVEKIEDPGAERTRRNAFPEVVASIYTRNTKSKLGWHLGDRFIFNQDNSGEITYRRGTTLLYIKSDQPLKRGIAGVQTAGRWSHITANVTPPTPEGIVTTLDNFLTSSERIIEQSKRPTERAKALGWRALKGAHTKLRYIWYS